MIQLVDEIKKFKKSWWLFGLGGGKLLCKCRFGWNWVRSN